MKRNKKILYFVQLPPPVHGVSIINEIVFNNKIINQDFEKKLVEIKFSEKIDELRKFSLLKLWIFFKTMFQLKFTLLKFKPDLVYFSIMSVGTGFLRDALFALIIKSFGKKIIFHLHNRGIPYYNKKFLYHLLYKAVFKNSTIIHLSNKLLETEIRPLAIKGVKIYIVSNTIKPHETSLRIYNNKKLSILFLSNYFPEKGLLLLLKAIKIMKNKYPQIRLNAYGASQSEDEDLEYMSFIKMNNLEDSIFIHGPVYGNEKKKVFEENDLFVFPSYFREECFPLSILEAMNAKMPIIATRIGAIPEMIENGEDGLLVDPLTSEQLAQRIEFLLNNLALRKKVGQNAYMKFKKNYSYTVFEKKMGEIFETVLSQ